jgi:dephospho-CoA kinase
MVNGEIDRRLLAAIVFSDRAQLEELEAITHPAIGAEIVKRAHAARDRPVVVELPVPAIVGPGWTWIAVIADPPERIARAVARGMEEPDAKRRIASQLSETDWREKAALVIVNDGSLEELSAKVDALWEQMVAT